MVRFGAPRAIRTGYSVRGTCRTGNKVSGTYNTRYATFCTYSTNSTEFVRIVQNSRQLLLRILGVRIAHSGDSIPASEGRDAPRFDAESASWATPTHEAFMVHAAAAAAARALARAIREYAKRRLIDHYLVEVAANAVVIPRPDISAFTT